MFDPIQCRLWSEPTILADKGHGEVFENIETFRDSSHDMRALVRCRECGQRYIFDYHEEIDWENGNDPTYLTYVPVRNDADIAQMRNVADQIGILQFHPRLQYDRPNGQPRWLKDDQPAPSRKH
ncbi:hypothetical protein G5B38_00090 [Pseudohalocynthiibacter aestuariivivens]|nr:hypothetical protein [Pseudohalocynthiibacter aestuariivivens]QIE44050.1 hypothetical protein G5B38_00090 [Pseudohalocynthiibacter aestuariivivens]